RRAGDDHAALMRDRGLYLVVELPREPLWTDGDATRLAQVVGNLLHNAAKFTAPGGRVHLALEVARGAAEIHVRDTGVGIEPDLLAEVFEPFVQGERPLDRSQGGLGIGLTLVRRLAELHGGSVSAQSEGAGRGSTFTLRIPAVEPPAAARTRLRAPSTVPARDVLVVEDNDDARETLKRMLELAGHHVRVAVDGSAALDAVRSAMPDIALIDIGLPQMDGYEVARRIRAVHDKRPLLVAITGYGLPEDRNRSREAGFDMHLVKPVDNATLAEVLARP
ncbi:MAG TPA: ATP-binding protein, partial [Burkholderiales bacterium]|nr:ATP-binding protein [Burkholderiales bacterium]